VWECIAADGVSAAARMDELFTDAAMQLADFPELGLPGKIAGTREPIPNENYRLVYEIEGGTVWMLALVHTARLWPPLRD
jgi:toxin ParE1/3/4